ERPHEHGPFRGVAASVPGSSSGRIRRFTSREIQNQRIASEILVARVDEAQTPQVHFAARENRLGYSDTRLVARRAASDAARHLDAGGNQANEVVPRRRDTRLHSRPYGPTREHGLSPLGFDDSFSLDEEMEDSDDAVRRGETGTSRKGSYLHLAVILFAAIVYLGCAFSPPSLMDDVDAVQAQIAHNMLQSGDWVTARLDGVAYLEKSPLVYWSIATSYAIFGVHDWAARIPIALSVIALCWLTACFGAWAFGRRAGFYAGLCLATCVGLFLFTRILIPDVMLTITVALAMWAFLRVLEEEETHPRFWALVLAASLGIGLLLKSLIAVVFPCGAAFVYLLLTRQLFLRRTWRRLHVISGLLVILLIAAPWHVLATLRNPHYFAFTMHSGPGEYHGFLWFYFINEQLLRFLNLRYPRDYNTVPRLYFWLLNLVWLFPWSAYFPATLGLSYKPVDRAARTRLLALCWAGFLLIFFTFSTTQEYYSMPCYPALALLLGSAMDKDGEWVRRGTKFLLV